MFGIPHPHKRIRFLALASLVFGLALLPIRVDFAQGACPPVSNNGWWKCAIVYYTVTGFDAGQTAQITNALSSWNNANQGTTRE